MKFAPTTTGRGSREGTTGETLILLIIKSIEIINIISLVVIAGLFGVGLGLIFLASMIRAWGVING